MSSTDVDDTGHDDTGHDDTGHDDTVDTVDAEPEYGALFWIGVVVGWAAIVYGAVLFFGDPEASWFNTARLTALGLIVHDGLWLTISVGLGWLLARVLGRHVPYWIRWAAWSSGIVIAIWFPLARGYGDRLGNPTILPRNYTSSILILLAVIWVGGAIYGAIARSRTA